jgi:hypothetical protein
VFQYFARAFKLMDLNNPNDYFCTFDNLKTDEEAIFETARHSLEFEIGDIFFNGHYRNHFDVLAESANHILEEMFGK